MLLCVQSVWVTIPSLELKNIVPLQVLATFVDSDSTTGLCLSTLFVAHYYQI